jgi:hypothetical protein
MAVTDITPLALVMDTASADLPDAAGTSIAAGVDGFSIVQTATSEGYGGNLLLKFVEAGADTATVTINAGAKPPSMRADLGDLTFSLAASDVKHIVVEQGRYTQSDGTITGTVAGNSVNDVKMAAFRLPRTV